jgi:Dam-replacing HTH domain
MKMPAIGFKKKNDADYDELAFKLIKMISMIKEKEYFIPQKNFWDEITENDWPLQQRAIYQHDGGTWDIRLYNFCIQKFGYSPFKLTELYKFCVDFGQIYPNNGNIEASFRGFLQILRDRGMAVNSGRGMWRMVDIFP